MNVVGVVELKIRTKKDRARTGLIIEFTCEKVKTRKANKFESCTQNQMIEI